MYNSIFESIGLSPNEAKIYEALLHGGEMSVSDISNRSKVHRRNVYDAVTRLSHKGLLFTIFQKGENRYRAVAPDKLMELVDEKRKQLDDVLPDLRAIYEEEEPTQAAFIYKGLEGFKNYMRDLVRVAEDVYFLGAKGLWYTPGIDISFLNSFQQIAEQKKLKYKTLYDPRVPEVLPHALEEVGGDFKVLPEGYPTPGVMDIFGDYVVTFTSNEVGNFGEDGSIFVMIEPQIAETMRTWFQYMWDKTDEYTK